MKITSREDLTEIYSEAKKRVALNCDDYHGHSALKDCLSGDEDAIKICQLYEYICKLEKQIKDIAKKALTGI